MPENEIDKFTWYCNECPADCCLTTSKEPISCPRKRKKFLWVIGDEK